MKKIVVIHGPNLNRLGSKDPKLYGKITLPEINQKIEAFAVEKRIDIKIMQFNTEGEIIEAIHAAEAADGIVINPAAFTHYAYAIRSALESVPTPAVEVHISNIHQGDAFRKTSVTAPACKGQISGLGWRGYILAITYHLEVSEA